MSPSQIQPLYSIDYETCSEADLRKVGAFAYARHPTTRVLCVTVRDLLGEYRSADINSGSVVNFVTGYMQCTARKAAWNAEFEYAITKYTLGIETKPDDWYDTMALAAINGLPLKLETCAQALALSLPQLKDMAGHRLMLKMARPRDKYVDPVTWWHEDEPELLSRLLAYNVQDVRTEHAVWHRLRTCQDYEQDLWRLNLEMNERGILLDRHFVDRLRKITRDRHQELACELSLWSQGELTSPNQVARIRNWVNDRLLVPDRLPDLARARVTDFLASRTLPRTIYKVLETRLEASKTSTAKLNAMEACADPRDNRMRGLVRYCGASRTGRFAGRLVQPQNFPRPVLNDVDTYTKEVIAGLAPTLPPDVTTMDAVSSSLRGCLIARPGQYLYAIDFSQIEARVVAWLAGQQDILKVFHRGEDVYTYTAAQIGSNSRQLGKVLVLACGFGMGPDRFQETAQTYGMSITRPDAQDFVYGWRRANHTIPVYWRKLERCFRKAMSGTTNSIGSLTFHSFFDRVEIELPSTRRLVYWAPELTDGILYYEGMSTYTHKWELISTWGGKITENVVQAVARDVMAQALLRCQRYKPILTVHDEVIFESWDWFSVLKNDRHLQFLITIMVKPPLWAKGLPIAADGYMAARYRKG